MIKKGSQGKIIFKNDPLITAREDFQRVVKELRDKWNIPPDGFKKYEDYKKWITGLTTNHIYKDQQYSPSRYSLLLSEIRKLSRDKLKLPPHWTTFIIDYLITGKVINEFILRSGRTYNTPSVKVIQTKSGEHKIQLEFGANTGKKDIDTVWGKVKEIQKTLPDYDATRIKRILTKYPGILKKIKAGEKPKQIYNALPPPENPDDVKNLDSVSKASQRIKKIIKGQ